MTVKRPPNRFRIKSHEGVEKSHVFSGGSFVLGIGFILALAACAGPAKSSLDLEDIEPVQVPASPLPVGDVYADEETFRPDMTIAPGDTLEISLRAGKKADSMTAIVPDDGVLKLPLIDTAVSGLTVKQAESRIEADLLAFYRDPLVQVSFKKKKVRVKQVLVVGEVLKPGVIPLTRHMDVLTSIAKAGNYKESALLEEIRIIRVQDQKPEVLTADVARLLTYGDWSKNLNLHENDIVFVPRSSYGKSAEFGRRLLPFVQLISAPFVSLSAFKVLTE
ncbi:MAG: hypothetical protein NPIRA05_14880 [Nitrospirales bacterium]|nr:MAG: hypothetical protein NPIRA05_14880 [Nitrospirales bacterium]